MILSLYLKVEDSVTKFIRYELSDIISDIDVGSVVTEGRENYTVDSVKIEEHPEYDCLVCIYYISVSN